MEEFWIKRKKSEQRRQGNLAEINGTRQNKTERTSENGETSEEEENENEYPENHTDRCFFCEIYNEGDHGSMSKLGEM